MDEVPRVSVDDVDMFQAPGLVIAECWNFLKTPRCKSVTKGNKKRAVLSHFKGELSLDLSFNSQKMHCTKHPCKL